MKKKKKIKIKYQMILYIIMVLIAIIFLGYVCYCNILPLKYMLLLTFLMGIWFAVIGVLLIKFRKNKKLNIVGYVMFVIMAIIMTIALIFLSPTVGFFKRFGNNKYKEENFLVLVLENSDYQKLEDLNEKPIGYVPNELTKINEALDKLKEKITYESISATDNDDLFEKLLDNTVEAIIIEEKQKDLFEENSEYKHELRLLDTIVVKTELNIDTDVNVTNDTFALYLTGIDTYGSINSVSRSDVNIVAVINPKTKQVLLVSIPRDYYVQLSGTTGLKDKLTHAGIYGVDTSVGTIENLLELDINYYFKVNFSSVIKIVDELGGIDVYSKQTFTTSKNNSGHYTFYEGYNHVNGEQALAFVRERKNIGGDRDRGENQQAVISALIKKATSSAIITKYSNILKSLDGTFQTNMTESDITSLIKMQLNDMASWNITSYSLDGSDGMEYTYSYPNQELYVMIPNEDRVREAISLIDKVGNGEKLESSYDDPDYIQDPSDYYYPKPEPKPDPTPAPEIKEPTITLVGGRVVLLVNDVYEEQGVTISVDASDMETKISDVVIEGNVDVTLAGEYTVSYSITDAYGKTATTTRTVIVLDPLSDDDGDGFSNQKEMEEGTNPLDGNDYPVTVDPNPIEPDPDDPDLPVVPENPDNPETPTEPDNELGYGGEENNKSV